jgi:membrane protease YdiL (CAAX protease family)
MPWDFWLIFLFLSMVLPWRGRQRMRRLMALPEATRDHRIRLYVSTILFQWLLTVVIAWRALARGLAWRELALSGEFTASILLVTSAGAALIGVVHWRNLRQLATLDHPAMKTLRALGARLFPRSKTELAFYILLALTAGLCEEFIFRGFVIAALFRAGLSTVSAVLLSSLMFGLAHLYQGKGGSMGTALLGILFGAARIVLASLIPVIIWHAVLDIVAGISGARYFASNTPAGTTLARNQTTARAILL